MAGRELVTRRQLQRELLFNAATKPLALAVAAGVSVAAFLSGAAWLLPVAAALYVALAAASFFDEDEAERVGRAVYARARALSAAKRPLPRGLAPEIAEFVERARLEEARILDVIAESRLPFEEVAIEVDTLMREMERIAGRAQLIWSYLDAQRPHELERRLRTFEREPSGSLETVRARDRAAAALEDQLRVVETLEAELGRFGAEMEHLIASLAVVHGQLVRMSVADEQLVQDDVAGQVRDLRERVGAVAEGMREAVAELDA
jgi:hypothetical protein